MAPATHSCDPSSSSNSTIAEPDPEEDADCTVVASQRKPETYYGRNMLSTGVFPIDNPTTGSTTTTDVRREEPPPSDLAQRSSSIVKEPAFIAAVVLTVLILLGGFIVTRLSNTPLPKRPRGTAKTGIGPATPTAAPGGPSRNGAAPESQSRTGPTQFAPVPYEISVPLTNPTLSFDYASAGGNTGGTPPPKQHTEYSVSPTTTSAEPRSANSSISPLVSAPTQQRTSRLSAIQEEDIDEFPQITEYHQYRHRAAPDTRQRKPHPLRDSWTRPRHDSDASSHTTTTEETVPNGADHIFSSSSSLSSIITSGSENHGSVREDENELHGDDELSSDEVDPEIGFEVKRGQTQSLELVKGVLVNWPAASASDSSEILQVERTGEELAAMQQNLKAPTIPALIVTQPSTLSLFTMGSSTSNFSVELDKFPLPPLHLEPTIFWQKLEDEINSSLALKRRSKSF